MQKVYIVYRDTRDYYSYEEVMSVWSTQEGAEKECVILKEKEDWCDFYWREQEVKE